MNDLILYKSEDFQGIVCDFWKNENNEIFMSLNQLAQALGYANKNGVEKILLRNEYLKEDEFSTTYRLSVVEGKRIVLREIRIFKEDGIFEISMLASTDRAKEFRSWVREILKGLRKQELILLKNEIEISKPKIEFYNQIMQSQNYLSMLQVSKLLKISGRNKLFKFLRDENVLMSKGERYNLPYQIYIERKYFDVVIKPMFIGRKVVNVSITIVSPKGLQFIQRLINRRQKEKGLQKVTNLNQLAN